MNDVFRELQKLETDLEVCGHKFKLKAGGRLKKRDRVEKVDDALEAYNEAIKVIRDKLRPQYPVVDKVQALYEEYQKKLEEWQVEVDKLLNDKAFQEFGRDLPKAPEDTTKLSVEEDKSWRKYQRELDHARDEPLAALVKVVAEVLNEHLAEGDKGITADEILEEFDEQAIFALADVAKNGALEGPNLQAVSARLEIIKANSPLELSSEPSLDTRLTN